MFYLWSGTYCNLSLWKKFPRGNVVKHHVEPGPFSWSRVDLSEPSAVWVLLCLSVHALFDWAVHTSAAGRGWPLEQMYPIVVHISLVTALPEPCVCILPLPMARAHSGIAADPMGVWPGWPEQHCSWATSGIAGLSWRLLLCSLCWFRHYLWLIWRDNTAVVQGEAVNTVLNIQTVLWIWEVKAWHNLSSWPLYFTLLLQYFYCNYV